MDIIYNITLILFCLIVGYLFGSIPSGVWIGKLFFKQDPRDFGSHNSGGTNASRLWGIKYGLLVYLFDFLKVAIPLWGVWALLTFVKIGGVSLIPTTEAYLAHNIEGYVCAWPVYWLVPLAAVIGHCYPIFAQLKGGKAASVTFSSAIFSSWFVGLASIISFAVTLKVRKYISLASMVGSAVAAVSSWLTCIPVFGEYAMYGNTLAPGYIFAIIMTLCMAILFIRHTSNIDRIKNGTERKINFM
jgi:glycerol-3-phosphate acyltransferase PlsY